MRTKCKLLFIFILSLFIISRAGPEVSYAATHTHTDDCYGGHNHKAMKCSDISGYSTNYVCKVSDNTDGTYPSYDVSLRCKECNTLILDIYLARAQGDYYDFVVEIPGANVFIMNNSWALDFDSALFEVPGAGLMTWIMDNDDYVNSTTPGDRDLDEFLYNLDSELEYYCSSDYNPSKELYYDYNYAFVCSECTSGCTKTQTTTNTTAKCDYLTNYPPTQSAVEQSVYDDLGQTNYVILKDTDSLPSINARSITYMDGTVRNTSVTWLKSDKSTTFTVSGATKNTFNYVYVRFGYTRYTTASSTSKTTSYLYVPVHVYVIGKNSYGHHHTVDCYSSGSTWENVLKVNKWYGVKIASFYAGRDSSGYSVYLKSDNYYPIIDIKGTSSYTASIGGDSDICNGASNSSISTVRTEIFDASSVGQGKLLAGGDGYGVIYSINMLDILGSDWRVNMQGDELIVGVPSSSDYATKSDFVWKPEYLLWKPQTPSCANIITSITTPSAVTVSKGSTPTVTATATYLDGHTATVTLKTDYSLSKVTKYNMAQEFNATYTGAINTAKYGSGTISKKVQITTTFNEYDSYLIKTHASKDQWYKDTYAKIPDATLVLNDNESLPSITMTSKGTYENGTTATPTVKWTDTSGNSITTASLTKNSLTKVLLNVKYPYYDGTSSSLLYFEENIPIWVYVNGKTSTGHYHSADCFSSGSSLKEVYSMTATKSNGKVTNVTYKDATALCDTVVKSIDSVPSVEVKKYQTPTVTASVTYLDGHTGTITMTSNYSLNNVTAMGRAQTFTASYYGKYSTAKQTATVNRNVDITTIGEIVTNMAPSVANQIVYEGDSINLDVGTITTDCGSYTKSQFTAIGGSIVSTYDNTKIGVQTVNVTAEIDGNVYISKTTISVRVLPKPSSVSVNTVTRVNKGTAPVYTVTVTYSNGATKQFSGVTASKSGNIDYTNSSLTVSKTYSIQLTYTNKNSSESGVNYNTAGQYSIKIAYVEGGKSVSTTTSVNVYTNCSNNKLHEEYCHAQCPICSDPSRYICIAVPTAISFSIDGSATTAITQSPLKMINYGGKNVNVGVSSFKRTSGNYTPVLPTAVSKWNTLSRTDRRLALGLEAKSGSGFTSNGTTTWANTSGGQNSSIGVLKTGDTGNISLVTYHGQAFTSSEQNLELGTYSVTWNVSSVN